MYNPDKNYWEYRCITKNPALVKFSSRSLMGAPSAAPAFRNALFWKSTVPREHLHGNFLSPRIPIRSSPSSAACAAVRDVVPRGARPRRTLPRYAPGPRKKRGRRSSRALSDAQIRREGNVESFHLLCPARRVRHGLLSRMRAPGHAAGHNTQDVPALEKKRSVSWSRARLLREAFTRFRPAGTFSRSFGEMRHWLLERGSRRF